MAIIGIAGRTARTDNLYSSAIPQCFSMQPPPCSQAPTYLRGSATQPALEKRALSRDLEQIKRLPLESSLHYPEEVAYEVINNFFFKMPTEIRDNQYRSAEALTAPAVSQTAPTPDRLKEFGFTIRESEVLHWVIEGKRDFEISVILSANRRTVEKHIENILRKLRVETRTGTVRLTFSKSTGGLKGWPSFDTTLSVDIGGRQQMSRDPSGAARAISCPVFPPFRLRLCQRTFTG